MAGKLPYGFKASALARHLGVRDRSLYEMEGCPFTPEDIDELMDQAARISALTVLRGGRPLVIYNPEHSAGRRANDVVHELSHILRKHPPRPAIGFGGCRE